MAVLTATILLLPSSCIMPTSACSKMALKFFCERCSMRINCQHSHHANSATSSKNNKLSSDKTDTTQRAASLIASRKRSVSESSCELRCFNCSRNEAIFCGRSEEHTSELQSRPHLVCRLLLEKKKQTNKNTITHS